MGSALLLMGDVVAGAYGIRPIGHEEAPKALNHALSCASKMYNIFDIFEAEQM